MSIRLPGHARHAHTAPGRRALLRRAHSTNGSSTARSGAAASAATRATPSDRLAAAARIAFGLAWAADAALKWQPAFARANLLDTLRSASHGQPPVIAAWIRLWGGVVAADPAAWALLLAVAETLLAAVLITGALTNLACAAGATLSLMIWTTAEGLGGPYTPGSMDIGASIAYAIAFALIAASHAGATWGLDARLHTRLGPLRRLASAPR